jgi:hypothetical protein
MKTLKMSVANIQGKMSRMEMRNIMAGSGGNCYMRCSQSSSSFAVSDCSMATYNAQCPNGSYSSCAC